MAVNPYLQTQADNIATQGYQQLNQQALPQVRSAAQGNGQYGGSRQGIAEGVAMGNAATGIAAAQGNLYSNAYTADQQNQTQAGIAAGNNAAMLGAAGINAETARYNAGLQYNLGLGNLYNTSTANNQNFYSTQRGQDLTQYGLGAQLYGQGITGQTGVGQGQYGVGQSEFQAPITALQNYSNTIRPFSGLNSSATESTVQGGGATGALGGALAGTYIARNLGFGSMGNVTSNYGGSSSGVQSQFAPETNQYYPTGY